MPTSGNTSECLDHFLHNYEWEEIQAFVARFADVNTSTVRRWYNGSLPNGEELLRVRVLLDMAGYKVEEFSILPDAVKQFARLVALEAITIEGARELLDYKNSQDVYRIVLKGSGLTPHRQYRLTTFVEQSTEELNMMVTEVRENLEKLQPLQPVGSFQSHQAEEETTPGDEQPKEAPKASELDSTAEEEHRSSSGGDILPSTVMFDEEALAHALVSAVQLTKSLAQAMDASSSASELRSNVRFALEADDIDAVLTALEGIRDS